MTGPMDTAFLSRTNNRVQTSHDEARFQHQAIFSAQTNVKMGHDAKSITKHSQLQQFFSIWVSHAHNALQLKRTVKDGMTG